MSLTVHLKMVKLVNFVTYPIIFKNLNEVFKSLTFVEKKQEQLSVFYAAKISTHNCTCNNSPLMKTVFLSLSKMIKLRFQ